MLKTLSVRNAKRQAREYIVYFFTIVISVALLFAFNSLVNSDEILYLGRQAGSVDTLITMASIVIVFIIGWLVHYMTSFMLKRRSKEFGMYMLLGIEHQKIRKLFFNEHICIGAIAFLAGLPTGIFMYQIIRAIVMHAYGIAFSFQFVPSGNAILRTFIYVLLIYSFSIWKGRRKINKMNIYQLLYFEKEQEQQLVIKESGRKGIFTAAVIAGAVSMVMFWSIPKIQCTPGYVMIAIALGIIFLYGFYLSIGKRAADYLSKKDQKKYKNDNLFLFRLFSSKMTTMSMTAATLALLFSVVISTLGMALMMDNLLKSELRSSTTFDLTISENYDEDYAFSEELAYINENAQVKDSHIYNIYQSDNSFITEQLGRDGGYEALYLFDFYMKRSDYDKLRDMLGYEPADEASDNAFIHCSELVEGSLDSFWEERNSWEVSGREYITGGIYTEDFEQLRWDGNGYQFIIVVPDEAVQNMDFAHKLLAATAVDEFAPELYEQIPIPRNEDESEGDEVDEMDDQDYDDETDEGEGWEEESEGEEGWGYEEEEPEREETILIMMKSVAEENNTATYIMMVMPLFYITFIILITATTILVSQQLSESDKYKKQYKVLSTLGMSKKRQKKVLQKQMFIYYGIPVLFPFVFGFIILRAFAYEIGAGLLVSLPYILSNIIGTFLIFLFIYGLYIAVSYISLKQHILDN